MPPLERADRILRDFASRTGVGSAGDRARRYLWTDAHAVDAWLRLYAATGQRKHLERASKLADLVHGTLGRHRTDDPDRRGWISGLPEDEGVRHPTAGGLRIGKRLPERAADAPFDERLEWERDGQYFHYLTQWMRALAQLALATGDSRRSAQAVELARTAAGAFIHRTSREGGLSISWKMSIDLSRPLVPSMGLHDPIDGLLAFAVVRRAHHEVAGLPAALDEPIERLRAICATADSFGTIDPLGLGCLLLIAEEWIDLAARGAFGADGVLHRVLADAHRGLDVLCSTRWLDEPPARRLAFRELGLSLGLRALPSMAVMLRSHPGRFGAGAAEAALAARLAEMRRFEPVARQLEELWLGDAAQGSCGWTDHIDLNAVSLAASLARARSRSAVSEACSFRPIGPVSSPGSDGPG